MSGLPENQGGGGRGANARPTSTRQLLRQQRELEEKRKFGLAPLAVDTVSHKEISPNIPQSIAQAPWYYGATGPTLDHQRKLSTRNGDESQDLVLQDNIDRVVVTGQASQFVAGACKNCGSRTHKTSECMQARKKVGAKYTNKVTGEDILLQRATRADGQKRDRFVGDVGVDLLRGQQSSAVDTSAGDKDSKGDGDGETAGKRQRPEDVFGSRSAQHGGVEIQELPKYLQNLDQQDDIFFDPKTGSMRGNPNASDPTKAFQGDLARYRSGDFFNYVEAQHRYLTGKSKSFVDFELDKELNAEKGVMVDGPGDAEESKQHSATASAPPSQVSAHDILVRALYGETVTSTATAGEATDRAPLPDEDASTLLVCSSSSPTAVAASFAIHEKLVNLTAGNAAARSSSGHGAIYGSYLDPLSLRWGYDCCKAVGRDPPGCATTTSSSQQNS